MATIAIGHCSHLLLKCRVANYKSLAKSTVLVGGSKFHKKVYFDQLLVFPIWLLLFLHTLLLCFILLIGCENFSIT